MASLQAAFLPARKGAARLLLAGTNAAGAFNEDDRRCVVAASGVTGAPLVKSFSSPAATGSQRRPSLPRSSAAAPLGASPGLWHLAESCKTPSEATADPRVSPQVQAESRTASPARSAEPPCVPESVGTAASSSPLPRADGYEDGPTDHAQFMSFQQGGWHMESPHFAGFVFPNFFLPLVVQAPALAHGVSGCDQAFHGADQPLVHHGQQVVLVPHMATLVDPAIEASGAVVASAAGMQPAGMLEPEVQAPEPRAAASTGRTGASRRQRRRLRASAAAEQQAQQQRGTALQSASKAATTKLLLGGGPTPSGATFGGVPRVAGQLSAQAARPGDFAGAAAQEPLLWPPTPESTPPSSPRGLEAWAAPALEAAAVEDWQGIPVGSASFNIPMWQVGPEDTGSADLVPTNASAVDGSGAEYGQVLQQLADASQRPALMEWVTAEAWPLASNPGGCRVVQKALEVADASQRLAVAEQLKGHVWEASLSPHANHVLQKCVEVLPPDRVDFVLAEMRGHAIAAARHRYGCRVLERVIEHCPSEQTEELVQEVLSGASQLCRHTFGNFVIQHILEHGTQEQRHSVAQVLHADFQRLARHRVASYVVRSALVHCTPQDREWLVQTMKSDAAELADLTHHHCGSFVVREMRRGERSAVEALAVTSA